MKLTVLLVLCVLSVAAAERSLPGTQLLETTNDLSREMVAGIDKRRRLVGDRTTGAAISAARLRTRSQ
jgi:hypothetical protein